MEAAAMAAGWPEARLLSHAGMRLGRALARYFPRPGTVVGYLGKGHNAGDALVAMGLLQREFGWRVVLRAAYPAEACAPLTRAVWEREKMPVPYPERPEWRDLPRPLVALDGLLGIGGTGPLRGALAEMSEEMAWLRKHAGARVAAVDGPSGVDPDTGEAREGAVVADVTFMIGAPKRGMMLGSAANHTGALVLVPVEPLEARGEGDFSLITPGGLDIVRMPRPFDFHKGMAGRVAILAGSAVYTGAAVLAATGALRAGAGFVVVYAPPDAVAAITAKCPPEIIVRSCRDAAEMLDPAPDALVLGPGLGKPPSVSGESILKVLATAPQPAVVDADALNFLAESGRMDVLGGRHVLTPHPGEFRRLAPDLADLPREEAARAFSGSHGCVLLLKGCRSVVAEPGGTLRANGTGTPGMSTGGQGDVLAGVIAARLAIGDAPAAAASFGAWLCGRAGELGEDLTVGAAEALTPGDVLNHLGLAFRDWREGTR